MMIRKVLLLLAALSILGSSNAMAEEQGKQSYSELGVLVTSVIQPSIGYWQNRVGVRVSGIYLNEDRHELHLNIGYKIKESGDVQHSLNLLTSWVTGSDPGADYNYAATGLAYGFNYKWFFVEMGLAVPWRDVIGNLDDDPVIPCGYVGYVRRFE